MTTKSIIKLIIIAIMLIAILVSLYLRSATNNGVKKLLQAATDLENKNDIKGAIRLYKEALGLTLRIKDANRKWNLLELKEMMNVNGWYIVQKLKIAYGKENIEFDFDSWKKMMGNLNTKFTNYEENNYSKILHDMYAKLP